MEQVGMLDPSDEIQLWCLHYVYQCRINQHLQLFLEGWNRKPLRTAQNKSPVRLWYSGLYAIANSDNVVAKELRGEELQVGHREQSAILEESINCFIKIIHLNN